MTYQHLLDVLNTIDGAIGGSAWFVYALLGTGLFFTVYLQFPQVRYFKQAIRIVKGRFDHPDSPGDTSHFQSLATALSGTVGTGNIAGVALAIHLGGPAALFWMLVTAGLGMTTKFVEVTLSHKYREFAADGSAAGGPMYYMRNKLNMKWMAVIFAIATILSSFGTGNMPQINSIANAMQTSFGVQPWITGAILAALLALIILGGIKRIAATTEKLVPFMAIFYFIGAVSVIAFNYENILPSLAAIVGDVFTGTAATGGFLGASMAFAFNRGVNRGLFSNEAGQGSAPIAHAAAKAKEPVSEGMVAILEPFIDTIVICSLTGLVLLSSGVWREKHQQVFQMTDAVVLGTALSETNPTESALVSQYLSKEVELPLFTGELEVRGGQLVPGDYTLLHARSFAEGVAAQIKNQPYTGPLVVTNGQLTLPPGVSLTGKSLMHSAPLTAIAFNKGFLGNYGQYVVTIGLLLFAFSTAISWSYYGDRAVVFLAGPQWVRPYHLLYVAGFFVAAVVDTTLIWVFSGIAIALMTLPNLLGILMLRKDMKQSLNDYVDEMKEAHPEYHLKKPW
jgi:AGCS family alanine or glycine:cation symporter